MHNLYCALSGSLQPRIYVGRGMHESQFSLLNYLKLTAAYICQYQVYSLLGGSSNCEVFAFSL
ncbi:hypothetical protein Ccrd_005906, partial [Cynara cardunculus var. scolymus]